MECINATNLRRKSGQMGHPALPALKRVMRVETLARSAKDIDSATSSERRRRGTPNVGSAAPPALHNLGDPSPSPPGLG
jgi:hypothetical protein